MFELADRLVGIYKTDNTTKTIAINPGDYVVKESPAAAPAPGATQGTQQQTGPAAGVGKGAQRQQQRQGKENLGKQGASIEHEQGEQQAMVIS
jgi:hypothetical protein